MSDATLGTLVLFSPLVVAVLLWPRAREAVISLLAGVFRFAGLLMALFGIAIMDRDAARRFATGAVTHSAPPPPTLEPTVPYETQMHPAHPKVEQYSPEWYDTIYDDTPPPAKRPPNVSEIL